MHQTPNFYSLPLSSSAPNLRRITALSEDDPVEPVGPQLDQKMPDIDDLDTEDGECSKGKPCSRTYYAPQSPDTQYEFSSEEFLAELKKLSSLFSLTTSCQNRSAEEGEAREVSSWPSLAGSNRNSSSPSHSNCPSLSWDSEMGELSDPSFDSELNSSFHSALSVSGYQLGSIISHNCGEGLVLMSMAKEDQNLEQENNSDTKRKRRLCGHDESLLPCSECCTCCSSQKQDEEAWKACKRRDRRLLCSDCCTCLPFFHESRHSPVSWGTDGEILQSGKVGNDQAQLAREGEENPKSKQGCCVHDIGEDCVMRCSQTCRCGGHIFQLVMPKVESLFNPETLADSLDRTPE